MTTLGRRTLAEIETQPECWERAVTLVKHIKGLPRPGKRVLVLGCGTSYHIGHAYAMLREGAGLGRTDAVIASEVVQPLRRRYDHAIAISRSGTSVELLTAVDGVAGQVPVTALLGDTATPLANGRNEVVDLSFADEESLVQTRFATTALSLLRASNGDTLSQDIAAAHIALSDDLPPLPVRQLVVLSRGWSTALAQEAALKCREAAAAWVEAYPAGEYRHGPLAAADPQTLVWGLTTLTKVLVQAVTSTGAQVQQPAHPPQAELVRLQRFAVAWAADKRRDADRPQHLERSVVDV